MTDTQIDNNAKLQKRDDWRCKQYFIQKVILIPSRSINRFIIFFSGVSKCESSVCWDNVLCHREFASTTRMVSAKVVDNSRPDSARAPIEIAQLIVCDTYYILSERMSVVECDIGCSNKA
jgi:hypothetical protein